MVVGRRAAGRPTMPGPAADRAGREPALQRLRARCCCTCWRCCRRCERGLVMVQAEVADRLAAAPGLQGLRRPVGQGRLVRRRTPGRARSAATSSGRRPTSTPGWSPGPAASRRPTTATREQVFAVVDAAFAQRRKTLRGALRGLAGSAEAAEAALRARRRRPDGPRRVARRRGVRPDRRGPLGPMTARRDRCRHRARARQDQPAASASGRRAPTASTRWRPSTRRSACTTTSP